MLTKAKVQRFRSDFERSVDQLERDYGVTISLGTIRYDGKELRAKMTAKVGSTPVKASKDDFQVGDTVSINHKKVNPNDEFRIIKINSKNVKVEKITTPDLVGGIITVSPSLLIKK